MTKSGETRRVRLRVICVTPPPTHHDNALTEFGLQDKEQTVHPGQARADGSVRYDLEVSVQRNPQTGKPRFGGPYVHGTPAAPFLYLSWRRKEAEQAPWIRRLKVPLAAITWEQIEAVGQMRSGVLVASVAGTGSATVPLLGAGWTAQETPVS